MKKNNTLLYLMLIGISMGGLCGWVFGKEMLIVDWIGEMFLDTLKMLVIPLIVSSMIVGINKCLSSGWSGSVDLHSLTNLLSFSYIHCFLFDADIRT